ncbi:hypothetical protein ACFQH6_12925 [Halobacteriaceae archaeon GCM10025711]
MSSIDSFPTKRGVASFQHGFLVVEESFPGYVRSLYQNYWESDAWWRRVVFIGFTLWPLFALGWLISVFLRGRLLLVIVLLLIIAIARVGYYARGFRSPCHLPLDQVESVAATRGLKGLTRPRIDLTYHEDGSTYKRRLNLSSIYTPGGEAAFEQAIEAFIERGFEVT